MKKIRSALLAALLLLTLSSCGEERENDETTGYDDSLIKELYSEEGEYTDGEGNTMAYCYHVPQLVSETAVAAALNAEIADRFGALAQEQKNMMASHASLVWSVDRLEELLERQPSLPHGARGDGRRYQHDRDVQL